METRGPLFFVTTEVREKVALHAGYSRAWYYDDHTSPDGVRCIRFYVFDGNGDNPTHAELVHVRDPETCVVVKRQPYMVLSGHGLAVIPCPKKGE